MKNISQGLMAGVLAISITGCGSLPGNDKSQGAVIGGATGAAVGAAVTKNRVLGAVIGGAVGAAGGYVIGANKDKILSKDNKGAEEAVKTSEAKPATKEDAIKATTADVNSDGFVTLDEVVAMKEAGLSDEEMIKRLKATSQVFELNEEQKKFLTDRGVSANVVAQLDTINQEQKQQLLQTLAPAGGNQTISKPR